MEACRKQYKGVGRPMKIGKEGMAGLITALRQYSSKTNEVEQQIDRMTNLCKRLEEIDGLSTSIKQDEAGREIYRAQIQVDEEKTGFTAAELLHLLESGNPSIYLRHHYVNVGILSVDPRPLLAGQEDIIADEIIKMITRGKKN